PIDDGDAAFGAGAHKALHIENMYAACTCWVYRFGGLALSIPVAVSAANALVAAGAERVATVFEGGTVSGEQDGSDVGGHSCMVECAVECGDGSGAECVTSFWAIKGNAHGPEIAGPFAVGDALYMAVVGNVLEIEALELSPGVWVKDIRKLLWNRVVTHMV